MVVRTALSSHPVRIDRYEERLGRDARWGLDEGERFLRGEGGIHVALRETAGRLEAEGIAFAVAGGVALFHHGVRRFTEDVDLLVTRAGLKRIHEKLVGLGYVHEFAGSKNLRHAPTGVRIEFLIAGQYPGDGKPKEIAFPNPDAVSEEQDGIKYLTLRTLIELKLTSGMTDLGRQKDLADVLELIRAKGLPANYRDSLHPFVQPKYDELWRSAQPAAKRYQLIWRNKWLTAEARSVDDMISALRGAAAALEAMRAEGVMLDPEGGTADDYAHLVTDDPEVAKKYGFHAEDEFFDPDSDGDEGETVR